MAVITHNVLSALKRLALPAELLAARPKRLGFLYFHAVGGIIHHARETILGLAVSASPLADQFAAAYRLLPLPEWRFLLIDSKDTFRRRNGRRASGSPLPASLTD
jgi:hypothetical protein